MRSATLSTDATLAMHAALDHVFVIARPEHAPKRPLRVDGIRADRDSPTDGGARGWLADSESLVDAAVANLENAGFRQGSSRRHRGQGTANRRFFFRRFMAEILFADDVEGLTDARTDPLGSPERFLDGAASPFGFCLRPASDGTPPPFRTTPYRPAYLPPGMSIEVAAELPTRDPLIFVMPLAEPAGAGGDGAANDDEPDDGEPRDHPIGARTVSGMTLEHRGTLSPVVRTLLEGLDITVRDGARAHRPILALDGARRGEDVVASPHIPLVFRL